METFPFTTAGAAAWQSALYASPAPVIAQEAEDVEADFKGWVGGRFELDAEQSAYLNGLDDGLTQHWGASVAFFIRHRLPIEMVKPETAPAVRSNKLVLSEEELRELEGTRQVSGAIFEGVLRFRITY